MVVVSAQLLLFLHAPAPDWFLDVALGIFAANHEAYLARRICRDGGVGVFDGGKYLLAGFLERCDEGEMQPLVFS